MVDSEFCGHFVLCAEGTRITRKVCHMTPVCVSFVPRPKVNLDRIPVNNTDKRLLRKQRLMGFDPTCSHCEMVLTLDPLRPNSAHLVEDSLSCPGCVNAVRKNARKPIGDVRINLTAKGAAYAAKPNRFKVKNDRKKLRSKLLASGQGCSHCGRELSEVPEMVDSAHLIVDRLACPDHVKIVRAYVFIDQQAK